MVIYTACGAWAACPHVELNDQPGNWLEVVKIDEKSPEKVFILIWLWRWSGFLSRVDPLQLKSLKMFVFVGKISHLSFILGLVRQRRFHIWHSTQWSGFMLPIYLTESSPLVWFYLPLIYHQIDIKNQFRKMHLKFIHMKKIYTWAQWYVDTLILNQMQKSPSIYFSWSLFVS